MWIPINLTVKRLGSHINTNFPFVQGQVRLITGENGTGKSIVTEGISIALLGMIIRKDTSMVDLINDNYDDAEVNFLMRNTLTRMDMEINRKFSRTKSQVLTLKVDGEDKKLGGVTPTEDYIFSLIGISKGDVLNYFIVHKDRYTPFFGSSDTVKKQVISRFSGANLVNPVFKAIEVDISKCATEMTTILADINRSKGMILAYQQQIDELRNLDPKKEREDNIKALENLNIERQKNIDAKVLESEELTAKRLAGSKKVILWEERLKSLKYPNTEADKEIKEIKENAQKVWEDHKITLKGYNEEKAELEKMLAGEIECPSCHAHFILGDGELDVEAMKKGLDTLISNIIEVEGFIKECEEDFITIDIEVDRLGKKFIQWKRIFATYEEMIKGRKRLNEALVDEIIDISKSIGTIQKNIEETKKEILKTQEQDIVNKKDELERKIDDIKVDIEAFELNNLAKVKELELYNEWLEHYKSFISYLANKAIKNIEGYTNLHLLKFKSDLQVIIEGHKELKKTDEIRDEITTHIVRNGRKVPFGRHSNGQRTRISLANIFALQNLINTTAPSGGLGYCILDEIIESIDARGVKGIVNTLEHLDTTIDLITHVNSEITGIPIIKMELENEVTKMTIK